MNSEKGFDKAFLLRRYRCKYDSRQLVAALQRGFGTFATLGSCELHSVLKMVLLNAATGSPWPLSNSPKSKYNDPHRPNNGLEPPLWQLVRASTFAPAYFPPGLLVVPVGIGAAPHTNACLAPGGMNLLCNHSSIPGALMHGAATGQALLYRMFDRCCHGATVDREVGDLLDGPRLPDSRLFSYLRYNADLSRGGPDDLGLPDIDQQSAQHLDSVQHIGNLPRIGLSLSRQVGVAHFEGFHEHQ